MSVDHASRLIRELHRVQDGVLEIGGIPVTELAHRHGTPLYVYDAGTLESRWSRLRSALPGDVSIYYSVKANPHQRILRFFLGKGCGLEIASAGELHQALQAGCLPENILFAGPGKTPAELEAAVTAGVGEIHVESLREIERVAVAGAAAGRRPRIAIRINPGAELQGGAMRMGGRASPFGVDEEQLDSVLEAAEALDSVEIAGIHLFVGTQILDAALLVEQYRRFLDIARRFARRTGHRLATVDFGGGYGIPYFAHETELDVGELGRGLAGLLEDARKDPALARARFLVEPGRFLVAEAGIYVARVTDIKESRSKRFAILDGGMHHHLAASGNLGQTIKRNFPIAALDRIGAPCASEKTEVVGPLCTPLDILGRGVHLPELRVGDLIGVFQSGAYARTASPHGFLSHPAPPEVWVEDGRDRLIRRRGVHEDLLHDQTPAGTPDG